MDPLTCPFCNPEREEIVLENDLYYARYDRYPVSPGHLLVIPFRHVAGLFDVELTALLALLREAKTLLDGRLHPDGYNLGKAAGQTVMHLIPRYAGDVEDPRGNLHHLLAPRYDREANRTRMADLVHRREKSLFVARLEGVLPLLRGRFGVAKIGVFGSTARGEDRPESDVDVLVEFAPGQTTFRNFMELAFYLEDLFCRGVDLVTEQGLSRHLRPYVEEEVIWCEA